MPDSTFTAVCLVIDRSGSMEEMRSDAEGGVNGFVRSQRESNLEGQRRTLRLVQFSTGPMSVMASRPFSEVPEFKLQPRGGTALLDAIGSQIHAFELEIEDLPEHKRPGNVVFAIMTDGEENASREYQLPQIKHMIERVQSQLGWNVMYLGANQDAIKAGGSMGIRANSSMTYTASSGGMRSAMSTLGEYVTTASSGLAPSISDAERSKASED